MYTAAAVLFLFLGASSSEKQGDFGIFTACITKNSSLRLDCYYAPCNDSTPYDCEFKTATESLLYIPATKDKCQLILPGHPVQAANETSSFNCTLTRHAKKGKRKEEKIITINYKIRTRKNRIKPCPATTGLLLHHTPTALWPVVILSLWKVLITDRQTV